jgi:hypothetical protein
VNRAISVPYQDREQTPAEALAANAERALADPEDRRVAARLLFRAASDPDIETMGDLIDRIEALDADQRRALFDQMREAAGLESATDVDARERFESLQQQLIRRNAVERDADGRALFFCAHPDCKAFPVARNGSHKKLAIRRWWCEQHRDLAAPGDMEEWTPGWHYSKSGAILCDAEVRRREADAERMKVELESRRHSREAEQAAREAEALERADADRAHRARLQRETPRGVPLP